MEKKIKYYGVAGQNGYGVYLDAERACRQCKYIVKFRLQEFLNQDDAKAWVIQEFANLQTKHIMPRLVETLDWTYYPWNTDPSTWKKQPLCVVIEEVEEKEEEVR